MPEWTSKLVSLSISAPELGRGALVAFCSARTSSAQSFCPGVGCLSWGPVTFLTCTTAQRKSQASLGTLAREYSHQPLTFNVASSGHFHSICACTGVFFVYVEINHGCHNMQSTGGINDKKLEDY